MKKTDKRMLLDEIKNRVTVHPSNFIIKIKKFPLNKNFKISYSDKIFDWATLENYLIKPFFIR